MRDPRGPWDVPDEPEPLRPLVGDGVDTDADGVPDTIVVDDGFDLLVATDLDGDGVADQVLRVTVEGEVHIVDPPDTGADTPGWPPVPQ